MNMGIGSILSFTGYFALGIPLAWYFAFHQGWGITGIWIGPAFACVWLFILYNVVIARIDLRALVNTIEERTRTEKELKMKMDKQKSFDFKGLVLEEQAADNEIVLKA